jgi:hypothetical protein
MPSTSSNGTFSQFDTCCLCALHKKGVELPVYDQRRKNVIAEQRFEKNRVQFDHWSSAVVIGPTPPQAQDYACL